MAGMWNALAGFRDDESGATAVEYGLIAALVAMGVLAAMTAFGNRVVGLFGEVDDRAGTAMDDAGV